MPEYSYRCDACDYRFDLHQGILEEKLFACPKCGEPRGKKFYREIGKGSSVKLGKNSSEWEIHRRERRG